MELISTIALIAAITTIAVSGIAMLPWTDDELDATDDAVGTVGQALTGVVRRPARARS